MASGFGLSSAGGALRSNTVSSAGISVFPSLFQNPLATIPVSKVISMYLADSAPEVFWKSMMLYAVGVP